MTNATQPLYLCEDAAKHIADLIYEEELKLDRARRRQEKHEENGTKLSAAKRDQHRAETTIRALKEALKVVLLERACSDGQRHPLPNVEQYLTQRRTAPVV